MLIDIIYFDALVIKRALQGYNYVLTNRLNVIINNVENYEKNSDYNNIRIALNDNEKVLRKFNKIK